jgi:hypothetical protein
MFERAYSAIRRAHGVLHPGRLFLPVLLPVIAGVVGYYAGAMRESTVMHLPSNATVALDQLVTANSFSEVEQARAVLNALAGRYIEYAQMMITRHDRSVPVIHGSSPTAGSRDFPAAVRVLEEAVAEFKGTGEELQLLPILLNALKRAQLPDRWLDVYLKASYEHPTHKLIGLLADEAARLSRSVCREEEVTAALRHIAAIPFEFEGKFRIERCLLHPDSRLQAARHAQESATYAPRS